MFHVLGYLHSNISLEIVGKERFEIHSFKCVFNESWVIISNKAKKSFIARWADVVGAVGKISAF